MASLTDQIGTVNSGKPIIDPGPANPSFIGALADFGASVVPGLARLGESRQQQRAADALDEAAGRSHELMTNYNRVTAQEPTEFVQSGPPPIEGSLEGSGVPSDAESAARDLERARRAREQGRISSGTLDLQIERLTSELFQKYPDQRAEISAFMQSRGFDHYMYRAAREEQAAYVAEQTSQTNALTTQFQYAAERGLVTNDTPLASGAAIGRRAMAEAARIQAAKERADAIRADRALSIQEQEAQLDEVAADATSAVIAQVSTAINPLVDQISLAVSIAATDQEAQRLIPEYQTRVRAALTAQRARAISEVSAAGGREDQIKIVTDFFDGMIESTDSLFTTSLQQNSRALQSLQSALGLNAAQAMPAYHTLVQALGQPAVNSIFADPSGVIALPEEVLAQVRGEIANFNPADPRGAVSLARLVGYLRREEGLQDLDGTQAASFVRTNARVQLSNQQALLRGDTTVARAYLNAATNTAEAMVEMPPTATSIASLKTATGLNSTPEARRALEAAMREDPEYGQAVIRASRNGAAKALDIARSLSNQSDGFVTEYDEGAGRYVTRPPTRREYDAMVRANSRTVMRPGPSGPEPVVMNTLPPYEEFIRNVPTAIRDRENVMNVNLEHLVQTNQYDEAFAGMTPRQARELLATGRMPSTGRETPDGPSRDENMATIFENLDRTLQDLIVGTTSRPVPVPQGQLQRRVAVEAEQLGIPVDVALQIANIESRWNPLARNPTTGAQGLFQINDDRPRNLDANIRDGLGFVRQAMTDAERALGRTPQGWEVYVAHQQGPGGGPALLNPANANRLAVDVLTPLYRNNRALAQSAVTGNGGRADMTVAEFLDVIKGFYETGRFNNRG